MCCEFSVTQGTFILHGAGTGHNSSGTAKNLWWGSSFSPWQSQGLGTLRCVISAYLWLQSQHKWGPGRVEWQKCRDSSFWPCKEKSCGQRKWGPPNSHITDCHFISTFGAIPRVTPVQSGSGYVQLIFSKDPEVLHAIKNKNDYRLVQKVFHFLAHPLLSPTNWYLKQMKCLGQQLMSYSMGKSTRCCHS